MVQPIREVLVVPVQASAGVEQLTVQCAWPGSIELILANQNTVCKVLLYLVKPVYMCCMRNRTFLEKSHENEHRSFGEVS